MKLFAPLFILMVLALGFAFSTPASAAIVITNHATIAPGVNQPYDMQFFSGPSNFTVTVSWNAPNRDLRLCVDGAGCNQSTSGYVEVALTSDCSVYCNIVFAVYNLGSLNTSYNLAVDKH